MELQSIAEDGYLDMEFIQHQILISHPNMLLSSLMKQVVFQNRVNPNNLVRITKEETGVGE